MPERLPSLTRDTPLMMGRPRVQGLRAGLVAVRWRPPAGTGAIAHLPARMRRWRNA